jgi:HAD superfamily phosphatase
MKALLFDMDGVLVDVSGSYRLAVQKTVAFFSGNTVSVSGVQAYKNRGGLNNDWDLTDAILRENGVYVERKTLVRKFQDYYLGQECNGLISKERWVLPVPILRRLEREYNLGIVTGRPYKDAQYVLERFQTLPYFPVVITIDDVPKRKAKPDPWSLELALERLMCASGFYLGDTVDDIRAAISAGLRPIGVVAPGLDGSSVASQKEILSSSGAWKVIDKIDLIEEVLK